MVWKAVVKEMVLREKQQLRNWKERICGLSELQPDTEGVLLCVDFCLHHEQLLAGLVISIILACMHKVCAALAFLHAQLLQWSSLYMDSGF